MKTCTQCLEEKELNCFYEKEGGENGLNSICRVCVNLNGKNLRERYTKFWQKNNPYEFTPTKRCPKCKEILSSNQFHVNSSTKSGLATRCKLCQSKCKINPVISTGEKFCNKCETKKNINQFYVQRSSKDGRHPYCKDCDLKYKQERKYGIAVSETDVCAICESKSNLLIDHCHESKKTRGILCHHCNLILGHAKDNPKVLKRAIKYLAQT